MLPVYREPAQRNATFQDVSWRLQPVQPRLAGKAVFLTDARAISYGESLLGIVASSKLGIIAGSRTAGTNGNIASMLLPTGHQIIWTGMQVLKRNGGPLHGIGISPDVPVKPTLVDLRAGVDTVLEAGRNALGASIAQSLR
jgi:C-terminal processing protease CtpA/Prc